MKFIMACLQQSLAGSSCHDKTFDYITPIIYSSLNNVITEALKNRVGKS
jgi:hypothetical protein